MEKLHLGVARSVITPEVGGQLYGYSPDIFSTGVLDDLTATAFYFKQGDICSLMVSISVCEIETNLSQMILDLIEERFDIPKENCMLCATHTHSGPNTAGDPGWGEIDREYCDNIFIPAILSSIETAIENTQTVKMGVASGNSYVGANRRQLTYKNTVYFGVNPWGCFNPEMTILSFKNEENETVANIIHYGAHCTSAGVHPEITRDWAGFMTDAVEKETGAITAFFNGPEGDVGPRLPKGEVAGSFETLKTIGPIAAKDALDILAKIADYDYADLKVSEKILKLPLKKRMSIEHANEVLEKYKDSNLTIHVLEKTCMENVIKSYENGEKDAEYSELKQTVIGLGNVFFASFPFELFSEIGLRIDNYFENLQVLSLSNTNGSEGYFVTQDALCRGGYEVNMFLYRHIQPYSDDVDYHLAMETIRHILKCVDN